MQLYMAGFWRGRARGVDDGGSSKTPLLPKKERNCLADMICCLGIFCLRDSGGWCVSWILGSLVVNSKIYRYDVRYSDSSCVILVALSNTNQLFTGTVSSAGDYFVCLRFKGLEEVSLTLVPWRGDQRRSAWYQYGTVPHTISGKGNKWPAQHRQ